MNYEKLYHIAFNAATDAIRFIDAGDCAADMRDSCKSPTGDGRNIHKHG